VDRLWDRLRSRRVTGLRARVWHGQGSIDAALWDLLRLSQPEGSPPECLLPIDGSPDPRTNLAAEVLAPFSFRVPL
jgi:hypothetical protein